MYSLAKGHEENQPLVDKYIEMIDSIEDELTALKATVGPTAVEVEPEAEVQTEGDDSVTIEFPIDKDESEPRKTCPQCGAPVSDDALFCNKCGAQL